MQILGMLEFVEVEVVAAAAAAGGAVVGQGLKED
jgi:hypothetical protein